jgi:L-lactate dehydrogenase complex protein LldG
MTQDAREEILSKLKSAPKTKIPPRPPRPVLKEASLAGEEMIALFSKYLTEETAVVHRVKEKKEALEKLSQIAREENLKKVMITLDEFIASLDLPAWGKANGVQIMTPRDFPDRDTYRNAVFLEANAGITSADFAVAESGSIGIHFNKDQARLVSLAPILHIAVFPINRVIATYEQAMQKVSANQETRRGQFSFITGPSMTADIQATPFKGMHGPRKVIAILVG